MATSVLKIEPSSISKARTIVMSGGLIVYPTDTVYGLGCDPFREKAVARLIEAKKRESKPIPVLCSGTSGAARLVDLGAAGTELASRFWPGALTIVAPLRRTVPLLLNQGASTLGVRVPAGALCRRLVAESGGYLTGTSANLSGMPSARSASEALEMLGDQVDLVLDGGPLTGRESTVVRVAGDEVTILRSGPVGVPDEMMRRRTSS